MATRIKLRRDTSTRWENINPILSLGEPGLETDTGKIKYGDGITTWNLLPYFDDQTMDLGSIDQHIIPDVDNTYDLGSPTKQWRELYVSGGSIYLGNIKLTNEAGKLIATKVINPGQGNEAPDPVDPDAGSDIGGGSADLGKFKISSSASIVTLGTKDNPDTNGWGGYDLTLDPGGPVGVHNSNIYIPGVANQAAGIPLQITNNGTSTSLVQVFGRGGVQLSTNTGEDEKVWEFGSNGDLTLPSGSTIRDIAALGNSLMVLGAGDEVAENQRAARVGLNGELESVGIGAGSADWIFTNNGKITLPGGGELWEDALIASVNQDLFLGTKFTPQESAVCYIAVGDEFVADIENNDDITVVQVGWTVNVGGTDYTVTAIDPSPPAFQYRITAAGATFVQGETYTFTNPVAVDKGWFIRQGTGTLVSDVGGAILSSETFSNGEGQTYRDFAIELATPDGLNEHRWTFRNDGKLELPVAGDIIDSVGNSVLGGGAPSIPNTIRGFINLVGDRPTTKTTSGLNQSQ